MNVLLDVLTCEINCSFILLEGIGIKRKKNQAVVKGPKAIIIDSPLTPYIVKGPKAIIIDSPLTPYIYWFYLIFWVIYLSFHFLKMKP